MSQTNLHPTWASKCNLTTGGTDRIDKYLTAMILRGMLAACTPKTMATAPVELESVRNRTGPAAGLERTVAATDVSSYLVPLLEG
jgi:hypothetical protein